VTPAFVVDVKEHLLPSPRRLLWRLSQQLGTSQMSIQRASKVMKFRAYTVRVVQELRPLDTEKRVRYCHWFRQFTHDVSILNTTFFTDKAWFHLNGYINSQTTRIWAAENAHELHQVPLHTEKIGV
jgi:hypothetical protein